MSSSADIRSAGLRERRHSVSAEGSVKRPVESLRRPPFASRASFTLFQGTHHWRNGRQRPRPLRSPWAWWIGDTRREATRYQAGCILGEPGGEKPRSLSGVPRGGGIRGFRRRRLAGLGEREERQSQTPEQRRPGVRTAAVMVFSTVDTPRPLSVPAPSRHGGLQYAE